MCGLPNWFEVAVERSTGLSFRVVLHGRTLAYETWSGAGTHTLTHVWPSPQAWREFLSAVEAIDLWHWAPEYHAPEAASPTTRWSIEIAAPGRQNAASGSDAYPPNDAFSAFCAALQTLLGSGRTTV